MWPPLGCPLGLHFWGSSAWPPPKLGVGAVDIASIEDNDEDEEIG